jgi:filamentous hemagglutinin family protein
LGVWKILFSSARFLLHNFRFCSAITLFLLNFFVLSSALATNVAPLPSIPAPAPAVKPEPPPPPPNLPVLDKVVEGTLDVSTPTPTTMVMRQGSQDLVADYNSFNVATGHAVDLLQPNRDALAVFRVNRDAGASIIDGRFSATGNVFLLNPNGILIGKDGTIDMNAFIASTHDDFLWGQTADGKRFVQLNGLSNPEAEIRNYGTIHVGDSGVAAFASPITRNYGGIFGRAAFVAGEKTTLTLDGSDIVRFEVEGKLKRTIIEQKGHISAKGKEIILRTADAEHFMDTNMINMDGEMVGAKITVVGGDGSQVIAGPNAKLDATGEHGGHIQMLGDTVTAKSGATFDASGDLGGGKIWLGGGPQGQGAEKNAQHLQVEDGVYMNADARISGKAGDIINYADIDAHLWGHASARALGDTGEGGFIEYSGKQHLWFAQDRKHMPKLGKGGMFLLDPDNVSISSTTPIFSPLDSENVHSDYITGLLRGDYGDPTDVTITAGNTITVVYRIDDQYSGWTATGRKLSLIAPTITINDGEYIRLGDATNLATLLLKATTINGALASDAELSTVGETINVSGGTDIQITDAGTKLALNNIKINNIKSLPDIQLNFSNTHLTYTVTTDNAYNTTDTFEWNGDGKLDVTSTPTGTNTFKALNNGEGAHVSEIFLANTIRGTLANEKDVTLTVQDADIRTYFIGNLSPASPTPVEGVTTTPPATLTVKAGTAGKEIVLYRPITWPNLNVVLDGVIQQADTGSLTLGSDNIDALLTLSGSINLAASGVLSAPKGFRVVNDSTLTFDNLEDADANYRTKEVFTANADGTLTVTTSFDAAANVRYLTNNETFWTEKFLYQVVKGHLQANKNVTLGTVGGGRTLHMAGDLSGLNPAGTAPILHLKSEAEVIVEEALNVPNLNLVFEAPLITGGAAEATEFTAKALTIQPYNNGDNVTWNDNKSAITLESLTLKGKNITTKYFDFTNVGTFNVVGKSGEAGFLRGESVSGASNITASWDTTNDSGIPQTVVFSSNYPFLNIDKSGASNNSKYLYHVTKYFLSSANDITIGDGTNDTVELAGDLSAFAPTSGDIKKLTLDAGTVNILPTQNPDFSKFNLYINANKVHTIPVGSGKIQANSLTFNMRLKDAISPLIQAGTFEVTESPITINANHSLLRFDSYFATPLQFNSPVLINNESGGDFQLSAVETMVDNLHIADQLTINAKEHAAAINMPDGSSVDIVTPILMFKNLKITGNTILFKDTHAKASEGGADASMQFKYDDGSGGLIDKLEIADGATLTINNHDLSGVLNSVGTGSLVIEGVESAKTLNGLTFVHPGTTTLTNMNVAGETYLNADSTTNTISLTNASLLAKTTGAGTLHLGGKLTAASAITVTGYDVLNLKTHITSNTDATFQATQINLTGTVRNTAATGGAAQGNMTFTTSNLRGDPESALQAYGADGVLTLNAPLITGKFTADAPQGGTIMFGQVAPTLGGTSALNVDSLTGQLDAPNPSGGVANIKGASGATIKVGGTLKSDGFPYLKIDNPGGTTVLKKLDLGVRDITLQSGSLSIDTSLKTTGNFYGNSVNGTLGVDTSPTATLTAANIVFDGTAGGGSYYFNVIDTILAPTGQVQVQNYGGAHLLFKGMKSVTELNQKFNASSRVHMHNVTLNPAAGSTFTDIYVNDVGGGTGSLNIDGFQTHDYIGSLVRPGNANSTLTLNYDSGSTFNLSKIADGFQTVTVAMTAPPAAPILSHPPSTGKHINLLPTATTGTLTVNNLGTTKDLRLDYPGDSIAITANDGDNITVNNFALNQYTPTGTLPIFDVGTKTLHSNGEILLGKNGVAGKGVMTHMGNGGSLEARSTITLGAVRFNDAADADFVFKSDNYINWIQDANSSGDIKSLTFAGYTPGALATIEISTAEGGFISADSFNATCHDILNINIPIQAHTAGGDYLFKTTAAFGYFRVQGSLGGDGTNATHQAQNITFNPYVSNSYDLISATVRAKDTVSLAYASTDVGTSMIFDKEWVAKSISLDTNNTAVTFNALGAADDAIDTLTVKSLADITFSKEIYANTVNVIGGGGTSTVTFAQPVQTGALNINYSTTGESPGPTLYLTGTEQYPNIDMKSTIDGLGGVNPSVNLYGNNLTIEGNLGGTTALKEFSAVTTGGITVTDADIKATDGNLNFAAGGAIETTSGGANVFSTSGEIIFAPGAASTIAHVLDVGSLDLSNPTAALTLSGSRIGKETVGDRGTLTLTGAAENISLNAAQILFDTITLSGAKDITLGTIGGQVSADTVTLKTTRTTALLDEDDNPVSQTFTINDLTTNTLNINQDAGGLHTDQTLVQLLGTIEATGATPSIALKGKELVSTGTIGETSNFSTFTADVDSVSFVEGANTGSLYLTGDLNLSTTTNMDFELKNFSAANVILSAPNLTLGNLGAAGSEITALTATATATDGELKHTGAIHATGETTFKSAGDITLDTVNAGSVTLNTTRTATAGSDQTFTLGAITSDAITVNQGGGGIHTGDTILKMAGNIVGTGNGLSTLTLTGKNIEFSGDLGTTANKLSTLTATASGTIEQTGSVYATGDVILDTAFKKEADATAQIFTLGNITARKVLVNATPGLYTGQTTAKLLGTLTATGTGTATDIVLNVSGKEVLVTETVEEVTTTGSISATGAVTLTSNDALTFTPTAIQAGALTLEGSSLTLGDIGTAANKITSLTGTATVGAIGATGDLYTTGAVTLTSSGAMTFTPTAIQAGAVTLQGSSLTLGDIGTEENKITSLTGTATSGTIGFTETASLYATGAVALTSSGAMTFTPTAIQAGAVTLQGSSLTLGNLGTAANKITSLTGTATSGVIGATGSLYTTGDVTLTSSGAMTFTPTAIQAAAVTLEGSSLTLGNIGTAANKIASLTGTATSGTIGATGDLYTTGAINLTAQTDLTFNPTASRATTITLGANTIKLGGILGADGTSINNLTIAGTINTLTLVGDTTIYTSNPLALNTPTITIPHKLTVDQDLALTTPSLTVSGEVDIGLNTLTLTTTNPGNLEGTLKAGHIAVSNNLNITGTSTIETNTFARNSYQLIGKADGSTPYPSLTLNVADQDFSGDESISHWLSKNFQDLTLGGQDVDLDTGEGDFKIHGILSLDATNPHEIDIGGVGAIGNLKIPGDVHFLDPVNINAPTGETSTLKVGGTITFDSSVDILSKALISAGDTEANTKATAGNVIFNGAVSDPSSTSGSLKVTANNGNITLNADMTLKKDIVFNANQLILGGDGDTRTITSSEGKITASDGLYFTNADGKNFTVYLNSSDPFDIQHFNNGNIGSVYASNGFLLKGSVDAAARGATALILDGGLEAIKDGATDPTYTIGADLTLTGQFYSTEDGVNLTLDATGHDLDIQGVVNHSDPAHKKLNDLILKGNTVKTGGTIEVTRDIDFDTPHIHLINTTTLIAGNGVYRNAVNATLGHFHATKAGLGLTLESGAQDVTISHLGDVEGGGVYPLSSVSVSAPHVIIDDGSTFHVTGNRTYTATTGTIVGLTTDHLQGAGVTTINTVGNITLPAVGDTTTIGGLDASGVGGTLTLDGDILSKDLVHLPADTTYGAGRTIETQGTSYGIKIGASGNTPITIGAGGNATGNLSLLGKTTFYQPTTFNIEGAGAMLTLSSTDIKAEKSLTIQNALTLAGNTTITATGQLDMTDITVTGGNFDLGLISKIAGNNVVPLVTNNLGKLIVDFPQQEIDFPALAATAYDITAQKIKVSHDITSENGLKLNGVVELHHGAAATFTNTASGPIQFGGNVYWAAGVTPRDLIITQQAADPADPITFNVQRSLNPSTNISLIGPSKISGVLNTPGILTLDGAATLTGDTEFDAKSIAAGSIDGYYNLILKETNGFNQNGAIGGTTPLKSLTWDLDNTGRIRNSLSANTVKFWIPDTNFTGGGKVTTDHLVLIPKTGPEGFSIEAPTGQAKTAFNFLDDKLSNPNLFSFKRLDIGDVNNKGTIHLQGPLYFKNIPIYLYGYVIPYGEGFLVTADGQLINILGGLEQSPEQKDLMSMIRKNVEESNISPIEGVMAQLSRPKVELVDIPQEDVGTNIENVRIGNSDPLSSSVPGEEEEKEDES